MAETEREDDLWTAVSMYESISYIGVEHFLAVVHVGHCNFALANIVVVVNVVRQTAKVCKHMVSVNVAEWFLTSCFFLFTGFSGGIKTSTPYASLLNLQRPCQFGQGLDEASLLSSKA